MRGIVRGPVSQVKAILRKCLSHWAVLNICFIGNITEIVHHKPLAPRLRSNLKLFGFTVLNNFVPHKLGDVSDAEACKRAKIQCSKCCDFMIGRVRSGACRQWYQAYLRHLLILDPSLEQSIENPPPLNSVNNQSTAIPSSAPTTSNEQPLTRNHQRGARTPTNSAPTISSSREPVDKKTSQCSAQVE